jgi:hypothetical protein
LLLAVVEIKKHLDGRLLVVLISGGWSWLMTDDLFT